MKLLLPIFEAYFDNELPKLKDSYRWKIPRIDGFNKCGEYDYSSNVELKEYFHNKWHDACSDEKTIIAKQVVSDWGGVRGNRDSTLDHYVSEAVSSKPSCLLKGVASYSKIFSITDLAKYAIYDARVAVSLNAIQWNAGSKCGLTFNYVPGRNNVTGNAIKKTGFAFRQEFRTANLIKSGWHHVPRDKTYRTYLDLLTACLRTFPTYKLYDLEMVLFANAEKECLKAMRH